MRATAGLATLALLLLILPAATRGQSTPVELLRIDGYAHDLVRVSDVVVADGRVVAGQPLAFQVRAFDLQTGAPIWSRGREGGGPGEFRSVSALGSVGDAFWVADARSQRISVFDLDGTLQREIRIPAPLEPSPELAPRYPDFGFLGPHAVLANDRLFGVLALPAARREHTLFGLSDSIGRIHAVVDSLPESPNFFARSESGAVSLTFPVQHDAFHDVSQNGQWFALAEPVIEGDWTGVRVRITRIRNGVSHEFRFQVPTRTISRAPFAARLARRSRGVPDEFRRQYESQAASAARGHHAFLKGVTVSNGGVVWVRTVELDERTSQIRILDPAGGRILERIELPAGTRIAGFTDGGFITVEPDEFDVESIVLYADPTVRR